MQVRTHSSALLPASQRSTYIIMQDNEHIQTMNKFEDVMQLGHNVRASLIYFV